MMAARCASQTSRVYLLWIFVVHIDRREKTRLIRLIKRYSYVRFADPYMLWENTSKRRALFGAILFKTKSPISWYFLRSLVRLLRYITRTLCSRFRFYHKRFDLQVDANNIVAANRALTAIDMFMVRPVNERFTNSRELPERAIVTFHPVTHVNLYNKNQIFQPSRPNRNFHEIAWRYLSRKRERERALDIYRKTAILVMHASYACLSSIFFVLSRTWSYISSIIYTTCEN